MTLVIIAIIFIALFALAFVTKRRFGILGLGLAAGALLASELTRDVAAIFEDYSVPVEPLSTLAAAKIALIILPPLFLLASGPSYTKRLEAFFGALGFALMATLLIIGPVTTSLPIEDATTAQFFDTVASHQSLMLAVMVGLSLGDVMLTHTLKLAHPSKKKKKHS